MPPLHRLLTCTAALLCAATLSAAENWPQFRGPAGDGQSDATGLPVQFSETDPPHSPTPVRVLTVSGAADAKANSWQQN